MLQVVPLEAVSMCEGGGDAAVPGYSGTALTLRPAPDAPAETLGFVLACPQVPNWMSPEYGAAVAEAKKGVIRMEDYTTEWFEKVIYLHKDDVAKAAGAPGGLAWTQALAQLGPAFDSTYSDGCALAGARTQIYRAQLGADGLPAKLKYEGVYYSLVWERSKRGKVTRRTKVKEIALAPLASRKAFVATAKHALRLVESAELGRAVDPKGDHAKARAGHLGMLKKSGKR